MSDFDARSYLRTCTRIVRGDALHANRVDWAAREAAFERDAADVPDEAAAHAWLRVLLDELGDEHSLVWSPAFLEELRERDPELPRAKVATVHRVRCAHVIVPSYMQGNRYLSNFGFAHRLLALVEAADASDPDGWVIDLRDNGGGNMWPMLAGLAPLLDGPVVGRFRDGEGCEERWRIDIDGSVHCGDHPCIDLGRPLPMLSRGTAPLAVLTSPRTCSSGEAVVVAFAGRAGARRFGQPTAGLSTANSTYELPDGAQLLLTTSVFVDRHGIAYGERIVPDEQVAPVEGRDAALEAACRWLDEVRDPR